MLDLFLTIACTTSIGVIVKLAETRTHERLTMLLFNYIVAAIVSFSVFLVPVLAGRPLSGQANLFALSVFAMILAPVAGFIFALNFFLMVVAIEKRGVALPVSLMRLSAIVPIAASMIFFGESPGWLEVAGIVGALAAAVLMSLSFRGGEQIKHPGRESMLMLVLMSLGLLFCFGLADLSMKLFERFGRLPEKPLFLAVLFAFAGITIGVGMIVRRVRIRWIDAGWGIILGVPNLFSSYFLVGALAVLASYIVFPMVTAVTVMLIALIGRFAFGEEIGKLGIIGIVLTLASIIAVNV